MGLRDRWNRAKAAVSNAVSNTVQAVRETVAPVVQAVRETVAPVVERVREVVAPVVERVGEFVAPVVTAVRDNVVMPVVEGVTAVAQRVNEARLRAVDRIAGMVIDNSAISNSIETQPARSMDEALRMTVGETSRVTPEDVRRSSDLSALVYEVQKGTDKGREGVARLRSQGATVTIIPGADGTGAKAMVVQDAQGVVTVAFRGTLTREEMRDDLRAGLVDLPAGGAGVRVQAGFKKQLDEFLPQVLAAIPADAREVTFTGHSLGGAEANIAAVQYRAEGGSAAVEVVTFGTPRTGNAAFAQAVRDVTDGNVVRVVNNRDPVVSLVVGAEYEHAGNPIVITEAGLAVGGRDVAATFGQGVAASANLALTYDIGNAHKMNNEYKPQVDSQLTVDQARLRESFAKVMEALPGMAGVAMAVTNGVQVQAGVGNAAKSTEPSR
ncbi:MAG: lipase family protein [Rickettsiales bacterium]|nr:lipase family protein [Rickettsiales bacterium]